MLLATGVLCGFARTAAIPHAATAAQNIDGITRELRIDPSLAPVLMANGQGLPLESGERFRLKLEAFRTTLENRRLAAEGYRSTGALPLALYREFIESYHSWIRSYHLGMKAYRSVHVYSDQTEPSALATLLPTANRDELLSALQYDAGLVLHQFLLDLSTVAPISVPDERFGGAYYPAQEVNDVVARHRLQLLSVLEKSALYGLHGYVLERFSPDTCVVEPHSNTGDRTYDARTMECVTDVTISLFESIGSFNSVTLDLTVESTPSAVSYRIEYVDGTVARESVTPSAHQNLSRGRYVIVFKSPDRAAKLRLGRLSEEASGEAIREPLSRDGIAISDDALAEAYRDHHGYPFFVQHWGQELWRRAKDRAAVTSEDVAEARDAVDSVRQDFYGKRYREMDKAGLIAVAYVVADAFQEPPDTGQGGGFHARPRLEQSGPSGGDPARTRRGVHGGAGRRGGSDVAPPRIHLALRPPDLVGARDPQPDGIHAERRLAGASRVNRPPP